jgi:Zn-dependent alcohol dehydrogenase
MFHGRKSAPLSLCQIDNPAQFLLTADIHFGMSRAMEGFRDMKYHLTVTMTMAILALSNTGCSSLSNTEKGAGIGGALGAGIGTAVGAATGNPKTGAVVGGLLGAGVGGAMGNEADERDRERQHSRDMAQLSQQQAAVDARKLGMIDIVQLNQNGIDSRVIINQIRATGSSYSLSTADIQYLTEQRVPSDVIVAMQQAQPQANNTRAPRTVYVREPSYVYERPVPVYVGPPSPQFGVTYIRHW